MSGPERTLALALVSHTNVGKTTLARTLLRRDVGEVLDQAHVTDDCARHVLAETRAGARLELWDTPGFGDSARLARELAGEADPIGALLAGDYDRTLARPRWCSQQAARCIRERADAVLYLVNAAELPSDAGYVGPELELLGWLGKPVLLVLNQTGPPREPEADLGDLRRWREHVRGRAIVAEALELDAFTRCWVEEGVLLERLAALLPEARRPLAEELRRAWREERLAVFQESMELLAGELGRAALDREAVVEGAWGNDRAQAMKVLARRLQEGTEATLNRLLVLHGLEGRAGVELRTAMEDFHTRARDLSPRKAGLVGGVLTGLLGGLAADVAAGGLSLGGGMLAGAMLGGLGGVGVARAYRVVGRGEREPAVTWSDRMLERTARELVLRYLAVAHFGRGRGAWREREHPGFWRAAVEAAVSARAAHFAGAWKAARAEGLDEAGRREVARRLQPLLAGCARDVLAGFYPRAAGLL